MKTTRALSAKDLGIGISALIDMGPGLDPEKALEVLRTLEKKPTAPAVEIRRLMVKAPKEDVVVQVIYQTPYVRGEIIIAGEKTREKFPLCRLQPLHFRKSYLTNLSRWETSPQEEAVRSSRVWTHIQEEAREGKMVPLVPRPLGATGTTFHSELLGAKSLGALSPIGPSREPNDIALQALRAKSNHGDVMPLWESAAKLRGAAGALHRGGMLHGDLHRENMMITPSGMPAIIDFETTEEDERFGTIGWQQACEEDLALLSQEAALITLCSENPEKDWPRMKGRAPELWEAAQQTLRGHPAIATAKRLLEKALESGKRNTSPALG